MVVNLTSIKSDSPLSQTQAPGQPGGGLLSRIRTGQTCPGCQLLISARFFPFYSSTDSSHTAALPPDSQSEQHCHITTQTETLLVCSLHLVETGSVQRPEVRRVESTACFRPEDWQQSGWPTYLVTGSKEKKTKTQVDVTQDCMSQRLATFKML